MTQYFNIIQIMDCGEWKTVQEYEAKNEDFDFSSPEQKQSFKNDLFEWAMEHGNVKVAEITKEFVPAEMLAGDFDGFKVISILSLTNNGLTDLFEYGENLINDNRCNSYLIATEETPLTLTFANEELKQAFKSMKSKYFKIN